MCGIAGIAGNLGPDVHGRLESASEQMRHRGPDDFGLDRMDQADFVFRRLSIIDLSAAGHQPMFSADDQVAIIFNGEIYNYLSLRDELLQTHAFRSRTDSEVLLNGFLEWGWEQLLRRIDGMFAFAIWDARTKVLHAARDRAGKKPLFYRHTPDGLAFASTLNTLRALFPNAAEVDTAALDAYLTYQAVPAPLSLFKDFRQLPPAHALTYDTSSRRIKVDRYWDISFAPKHDLSESEILDDLDALVHSAVKKRLMSDVPLGAFLSGGVDSSLVVSVMAREIDSPVEAVVMGFEEKEYDERPFARKVAASCGANLHEHILKPDAVRDLPEIIWHYGQPVADVSIVPTYYVAEAARRHVTVILNGDGGDEVFGGYARPVVARAAQEYRKWIPEPVRRGLGLLLRGRNGVLKKARMLAEAGQVSAAEAFVYDRAFRSHRQTAYSESFWSSVANSNPDTLYRRVWESVVGEDDVDRALYGDFVTYLPDQLLTKMDVSTMAHSVEARSPLLDVELMEYAAKIPSAIRLKGFTTKYLLKKLAERYVPREVLYRRKRGFVMPAGDWLRGELRPYLASALSSSSFRSRGWFEPSFVDTILSEHLAGTNNWGEQLWTLFVLELWARLMLDGTMSRGDSLEALL